MTKIADIIVPTVFNPYVVELTAEIARFLFGGIISNDPLLDALAVKGGYKIEMPFFKDLTGADEVLSDTVALTPGKITTGQDTASLLIRGRAWEVNDLAEALSGADPMGAIATLVATYRARRMQDVLINSILGVVEDNFDNDGADMLQDIFSETGADPTAEKVISSDALTDTALTSGDALRDFTGIAMHSHVYGNLYKEDKISFTRESQEGLIINRYKDWTLIIDDSMPVRAGTTSGNVYTTALFGEGAYAMGQGAAPVPTEIDRDALAGDDILIIRNHFIMHPRGIKSTAGNKPSNADLALAASHDRVWERKNVRMAFLRSNG